MKHSDARRQAALAHFGAFFEEVEGAFFERRDPLRQIALALLSREHVLMTGPPGTGKSQLASAVVARIVDAETGAPSVFSRQLTESTVHTDLIGSVDFRTLMESGRTTHFTDEGMLGSVHAFLDEVLDGRDMLLRATLNLLEERELKQGQTITRGVIESALMTTNRYLTEALEQNRDTLLAFIDRIAFVSFVPRGFSDAENLCRVVENSLEPGRALSRRLTLQDVDVLQDMVGEVRVPRHVSARLVELVRGFEQRTGELERSDPGFLATRYVSVRMAVRLARLLRAVCVHDKATARPERALVAELSDLAALRLALMVVGPDPAVLDVHLAQEHEPRERRQLLVMRAEHELWDACLQEVLAPREHEPPVPQASEATADELDSPAPVRELERDPEPPPLPFAELAGGGLSAVRALLERSREIERRDASDAPIARELRTRSLAALTVHVSLDDEAAEGDEGTWIGRYREARELCDALLAEGADLERPAVYAERWERAFERLVRRVEVALDARASSRVARVGVAGPGGLGAMLEALAPMRAAFDTYEAALAALAPASRPERLRDAVLSKRLAPVVEASYRRPLLAESRSAMRGLVREILTQLDALEVRAAVPLDAHLEWIVGALLSREREQDALESPKPPEPGLTGYRALRTRQDRAPLSLVVAEIALTLEGRRAEPRGSTERARERIAALPVAQRESLADRDLDALEALVLQLEAWAASGRDLDTLRALFRDEAVLVRSVLEANLVATFVPEREARSAALEARFEAMLVPLRLSSLEARMEETEARWKATLAEP